MNDHDVIFSGGSITDSVWLSWKDFVIDRYRLNKHTNNAYRGVGNEYIMHSTLSYCNSVPNPLAIVMLTNIDKWDWFVEDQDLGNTITREERHPVRDVNGNTACEGFWSTGSWFPSHKTYFGLNYYSEKYFVAKTLECIFVLQSFFRDRGIPNLILFDSPVLETTEQELNKGIMLRRNLVQDNALAKIWMELIDWTHIYQPGLIGFCHENQLDWHNDKYKGHPPSMSHLRFAESVVFPFLDRHFEPRCLDQTETAQKFNQLFYQ
jgi:hypothetical protein